MKFQVDDRAPFLQCEMIDVGMGVHVVDSRIQGVLRVTLSTQGHRKSARTRVSFADAEPDDYKNNTQIADLNMLNAALAVVRWKKLYGVHQGVPPMLIKRLA